MGIISQLWNMTRHHGDWRLGHVARNVLRLLMLFTVLFFAHRKLRTTLDRSPLDILSRKNPRFPFRYWPDCYLAQGLTISMRAKVMEYHYRSMQSKINDDAFSKILKDEKLPLWEHISESARFSVFLNLSTPIETEGELSIHFEMDGVPIFIMSFTIVPGDMVGTYSKTVILISRLQGVKGRFKEIRTATKTLSELSPPMILSSVLQGIAEALTIDQIAGVSAAHQPCNANPDSTDFKTAYDEFWISMGGIQSAPQFFLIPYRFYQKPLQTIKQNHRYRTKAKRDFRWQIVMDVKRTFLKILKTEPINLHG